MSKYNLFVLAIIFCAYLTGCNPQSKDLEVKIKYDHLCVFTDNPKTRYGFDNSIIISTGKIDHTREFKCNYEQLYKNGLLPVDEQSCIKIPINIFEKNVVYEITLEINKIYHRSICVVDSKKNLVIKYIDPGKSKCD
ncbi:NF045616 family extracytoplasmic (lipo)protein [Acinetobacter sp. ANC 3882]|uniref:NF045616 family extracytoplasmic (lipo)protein n=1 Tax=Acinetobacter sp. ANC 3882 TaxID=2923423 RepID=UPI001F4A61E5|nr:NF045616 family extracytoplasmic (lipo)protein [Acinetobacter sp. ANC 3882]MCH7313738.1 hypothetical protein [Acinetobacter sp. ANC 3882]